ncbi:hypothetical protein ACKS0A_10645 [Histoplasma ohiense]
MLEKYRLDPVIKEIVETCRARKCQCIPKCASIPGAVHDIRQFWYGFFVNNTVLHLCLFSSQNIHKLFSSCIVILWVYFVHPLA